MMRLETRLKATEGKLDTLMEMISAGAHQKPTAAPTTPELVAGEKPVMPSPADRAASSPTPAEPTSGQGGTTSRIAEQVEYLFRPLVRSATNTNGGAPIRPESRRGVSPTAIDPPSERADPLANGGAGAGHSTSSKPAMCISAMEC